MTGSKTQDDIPLVAVEGTEAGEIRMMTPAQVKERERLNSLQSSENLRKRALAAQNGHASYKTNN